MQGGVHARVDSVFEQRESIARLALADEPSRRSSTPLLLRLCLSAHHQPPMAPQSSSRLTPSLPLRGGTHATKIRSGTGADVPLTCGLTVIDGR